MDTVVQKDPTATVGHVKKNYLVLTQRSIHTYLANASRFNHVVLTDIAQNLDSFPIACSFLIEKSEIEKMKAEMGPQFAPFIQRFFKELDYPNCFERYIRENGIPLLHAHFGANGYYALNLKRRLGIPLITTFYGLDASKMLRPPKFLKAVQSLFQEGDLFLALGEDMARRLHDAGCPVGKICVQHVGADLERIPFRPRSWPGDGERVVLLYCGRLVEKKGISYALDAFGRLAAKWKGLEFRIVGAGPLWQAAERTVRQLNLQGRVVFRGALPHAETLQEMQNADLFLLPCVTAADGDMEGTPMVLIEAQASGMPVVSTFHADIPEVVIHGKTGFLVPERDSRALSDRLDHLLEHPDTWPDIGRAGRCHIENQYSIRSEVSKLEGIYADLIGA